MYNKWLYFKFSSGTIEVTTTEQIMEEIMAEFRTQMTFYTCYVLTRDIKMITRKIPLISPKFNYMPPLSLWQIESKIFTCEIYLK